MSADNGPVSDGLAAGEEIPTNAQDLTLFVQQLWLSIPSPALVLPAVTRTLACALQ